MAKNLGINIKIGADLKNFSKDMQNAARQMKRTGRQLQSIGKSLSATLTLPLGLAGAAMIKFASDTEESLNKVDVAFGESSKQVKEFADTTLKSFGIARGSALEMASTFGDMATSMGINQDAAASMSTKLVGLAGDLASFKNIRIDIAQTALNSIFTGETESLKKLGIVMTQANLSAFALEKGITKPINAMSEGEKVMLRYNFVMEKTTNAHGDFERTGGGAANQMRIFQESLKQLAEQFGKIILPIFTKLVQKVNEIISWFSNLSDSTKTIILSVGALVAAVGPLLIILGKINMTVASLIPTLAKMGVAITGSLGPFGILLTILGSVAYAFKALNDRKKRYAEISRQNSYVINAENELRKRTNNAIHSESYEIKALLSIARDETKAKRDRLKAIDALNKINPKYINGITLENVNTEKVAGTIDTYISKLKEKAKIQAASILLQEQYDEQIKNEIKLNETLEDQAANRASREKELSDMIEGKNMQGELTADAINNERASIDKSNAAYQKQIDLLKRKSKAISENISKIIEAGGVESVISKSDGLSLNNSGARKVKREKIEIEVEPKGIKDVDALKNKLLDLGLKSKGVTNGIKGFNESTKVVAESTKTLGYSLETLADQSNTSMGAFTSSMKEALGNVTKMFGQFVGETFTGFLDALGQEMAGSTKAIDRWGAGLLESFGKFLGELGAMVIAYGVSMLAIKKSFNPVAIIAAGAALVVIGGAIKQKTKAAGDAMSGGGTGNNYVPSVPTYGGGGFGSYGYGGVNTSNSLTLETVIYGNNLVLSTNRQHGTIQRTRGK